MATWNNTASGDNNGDISGVTVDFSAFGGGSSVAATHSANSWRASYTLSSASTAGSNLNLALTSVDDAGNRTTTTDTSNVSIDVTPPSVTAVTSSTANGSYRAGDSIVVRVQFNDTVTVTGSPVLLLETGTTDRQAVYTSGSGSALLSFTYTVQAGDTSSDLDYASTTALGLNGGSIRDGAGNPATLTLPSPGAAGSLAAAKALVIDTTAPTLAIVTAVTTPDTDTTPALVFSTNETGTLSLGGACGTSSSTSISATGNVSVTLTRADNATALADGSYTNCTVTVTDSAGNSSSALAIPTFVVDTSGPSLQTKRGLSVDEGASVTVAGTALASTDASSNAASIRYVLTALPANGRLTLNSTTLAVAGSFTQDDINNGRVAYSHNGSETTADSFRFDLRDGLNNLNNASGSHFAVSIRVQPVNDAPTDISLSTSSVSQSGGTNAVVGTLSTTDADTSDSFTYTLVSGTGATHNSRFNISGAQLRANDAGDLAAGSYSVRVQTTDSGSATYSKAFTITVADDVNARVNTVSVPANGTYGMGDTLTFVANFSEAVTVATTNGVPRLAVGIGSKTGYAQYLSGSGSSALRFRYTVVEGDEDTDGISLGSSIDLNGGTLLDSASLAAAGIGSLTNVRVDAVAPTLTEVTAVATPTRLTRPQVVIRSDQDGTLRGTGSCGTNTTASVTAGQITVTLTQPDNALPLSEGSYENCGLTVTDVNGNASSDDMEAARRALVTDNIDGDDCCLAEVPGSGDGRVRLRPGRNSVLWRASDAKGNSAEAVQIVNVRPLVSLSQDQVSAEGATVSLRVILNGLSPFYPLQVPYVIDPASTASAADHSLVAGVATFAEGEREAIIPIAITADADTEAAEVLIVRLDDRAGDAGDFNPDDIFNINVGARSRYQLTIVEDNLAPEVSLMIEQNGSPTMMVTPDGGEVSVLAIVNDANVNDSHSFDWSGSDNTLVDTDGDLTDMGMVFDPTGLADGLARVQVTVDDGHGGSATTSLSFIVASNLPELLPTSDTDGDGVDDLTEGFGDLDDDGIPNYRDNIAAPNILPESAGETTAFLIECDPGMRCRLGQFALTGSTGGARLTDDDLASNNIGEDTRYRHTSGVFDFEVRDLASAGQSVQIVIPQREAIPAEAVYRKFQHGQWFSFVTDAHNSLHSAAGEPGFCPPPGDARWQPGLTAGDHCVQLTIEDGGPNDADGLVNGSVEDPGAVATPIEEEVTVVRSSGKGGGGATDSLLLGLLLLVWLARRGRRAQPAVFGLCMLALVISSPGARAQAIDVNLSVDYASGSSAEADVRKAVGSDTDSVSVQDYTTDRTAYRLGLSYALPAHGWLAGSGIAVSYLNLGEVSVDLNAQITDQPGFASALADEYPMTGDGFTLSYLYHYDVTEYLTLVGELGLFAWQQEIDISGARLSDRDDSGIDPILGGKALYHIAQGWSAGVQLMYYKMDDQSVNTVGVLVNYRFN